MALINQAKRRTGLDPLAYMGVEPVSPMQFVALNDDPTINDWQNFDIGAIWLNTLTKDVWMLVSLSGNHGTWVKFAGANGAVIGLKADDGNTAFPLLGIINIHNTDGNIVTTADTANTVTENLANSITIQNNVTLVNGNLNLPNTVTGGTAGIISFGGNRFASNYGTGNTFYGVSSGNATLNTGLATANVGIGTSALTSITQGSDNCIVGWGAAQNLTTGENNVGIGAGALNAPPNTPAGLTTGNDNIAIGFQAGSAYTSSESNNIIIGSRAAGTVGESNTLRIGLSTGSGDAQINRTFIAGINGITPSQPNPSPVIIDSNGQLGTVTTSSTFTPILNFGGASTGITYDIQLGTYTRIGIAVFVTINITLSSKGTATGNATITGLPVANGSGAGNTFNFNLANAFISQPTGTTEIYGIITPGNSFISLRAGGETNDVALTDVNFENDTQFTLSGFYFSV